MLKLHAIYKECENSFWKGTVEGHSYITTDSMNCIDSVKMVLEKVIAEEVAEKYKPKRQNWKIVKETIIYFGGEDANV